MNESTLHTVTLLERCANYMDQHKLLIFFIPFAIYFCNGREISSGDPTPTFFVSLHLVKFGSIFLNHIHDYIPYNNLPYFVSEQRGQIVSNYPVFPGVMALPLTAPAAWLGMLEPGQGDLVWKYISKLAGSTYSALSVLFLYLTLKLLIDRAGAMVLSFSFGLGTAIWPIASQSLWQHAPSVFWWMVCFYFLLQTVQKTHSIKEFSPESLLFYSGAAAGCAVLCRTVNGVGAAWLCLVVLWHFRLRAWPFLFSASFLTFLLLAYNAFVFGSWKGGDVALHSMQWELDRIAGGAWETPIHIGFAGQLISPSRGILIFSPFLLFAFIAMFKIWKSSDATWRFVACTIPIPIAMLLLFSRYSVWWGGNSHFGPRYQIETLPFLMLYLAYLWPSIRSCPYRRSAFFLLLAYSLWVQWVGAFCYPGGWTLEPVELWEDKARFWNWSYNQIWTCFMDGIKKPNLF